MHDRVLLELPGVKIRLERCASDRTPHEVTLVLPRIEIRKTTKSAAAETTEEYIYNSITVVHASIEEERGRLSQSMQSEGGRQRPVSRCTAGRQRPGQPCIRSGAEPGIQASGQPMHPQEGRPRPGHPMYSQERRQRPDQPMHSEGGRQRTSQSMDNARAMLYTLKRWPALHGSDRPRIQRCKEADNRVLDRRDAADR